MSSSSRPPSPSPAAAHAPSVTQGSRSSEPESAPAPAPRHEVAAALTDPADPAGANPSPSPPVHPTMPLPSTDAFSSDHDHEGAPHRNTDGNPNPEEQEQEQELGLELSAEGAGPHPDRNGELRRTPSSAAMSKATEGLKPSAGLLETAEPDSPSIPSVIDISGPPREGGHEGVEEVGDGDRDADGAEEEVGMDTELTIHVDGSELELEAEAKPRPSDATDVDVDADGDGDARAHTDAGSTLYGSFAAPAVQDHPLSLEPHSPTARRRGKGDEEAGEFEYDEEDEDDEDGDGEDELDLGGGRGGRESPQRFVLTGGKVGGVRVQEFGKKPSHGRPRIPHSAYYFGPPPPDAAYGTDPVGQIGVHHPREIVRVERDYSGGELPQFAPTYPLELEGRITPTQFLETINAINELLISAHSLGYAFVDNALAYFTLQVSRAVKKTHYEKEMDRLKGLIDGLNAQIYNPVGLHIKWPREAAFLFLEIEYY